MKETGKIFGLREATVGASRCPYFFFPFPSARRKPRGGSPYRTCERSPNGGNLGGTTESLRPMITGRGAFLFLYSLCAASFCVHRKTLRSAPLRSLHHLPRSSGLFSGGFAINSRGCFSYASDCRPEEPRHNGRHRPFLLYWAPAFSPQTDVACARICIIMPIRQLLLLVLLHNK